MIHFEKDKKKLKLINDGIPLLMEFHKPGVTSLDQDTHLKLIMGIMSWDRGLELKDTMKARVSALSKVLKSKPLGVKILGSARHKNYIWIVTVDQRRYIIYLSLRGLSIEVVPPSSGFVLILKDLKTIRKTLF